MHLPLCSVVRRCRIGVVGDCVCVQPKDTILSIYLCVLLRTLKLIHQLLYVVVHSFFTDELHRTHRGVLILALHKAVPVKN